MQHKKRLILRYFLAIIFMVLGLPVIYFLLNSLTFYISYYSVSYFSPNLISSTAFIINNVRLNFINACTAGSAYLLLILLTLTVDIKPKKALKVLFTGSLLIFIANIIRIDILIVALIKYGSNLFNTLHLLFWKILSTLFVVFLWILLTKWFKIKEIPIYSDFKHVHKFYKRHKR